MIIIDENLLDYFRQKKFCELCGARSPGRLDPHHVRKRGSGGGFQLDIVLNLVSLCPGLWGQKCHVLKGDDPKMRTTFESIIARREGLENEDAVRTIILGFDQRVGTEVRS